MEETLKTVIDKETGQELRAHFHDVIAENEMLIDVLRTEYMENPYWDFENEVFYDKIIPNEANNWIYKVKTRIKYS